MAKRRDSSVVGPDFRSVIETGVDRQTLSNSAGSIPIARAKATRVVCCTSGVAIASMAMTRRAVRPISWPKTSVVFPELIRFHRMNWPKWITFSLTPFPL